MKRPAAIVTTGPASAPIDEVRCLTNLATGETGAAIAAALVESGWDVFLFRGRGATHTVTPAGVHLHEFTTNQDLARALEELSDARGPDIGAVLHAAALTDYAVSSVRGPDGNAPESGKIPGDLAQLHLVLEPAAKILPRLRGWFPSAWVVGWKYELEGTREDAVATAREQLLGGRTDATVVNGAAYGPGFGVLEGGNSPRHCGTKRELAHFLASRAATAAKSDK